MTTTEEKILTPRGIISETARRAEIHQNIVGEVLGAYEQKTLGTTAAKRRLIINIAKEVAREKLIQIDNYLDFLETL